MGLSNMAISWADPVTEWRQVSPVERAALPDLDVPTGVFGSQSDHARIDANDDNHAGLMSCLYPFHREG